MTSSSMMEDAAEAGGYELVAVDLRRLAIGGPDGLLVPAADGRPTDGGEWRYSPASPYVDVT